MEKKVDGFKYVHWGIISLCIIIFSFSLFDVIYSAIVLNVDKVAGLSTGDYKVFVNHNEHLAWFGVGLSLLLISLIVITLLIKQKDYLEPWIKVGVTLVIIVISIIAIVDMTSIKDTIKLDKELSELFGGDYDPESYIAYQEFMSTTFYIVLPACVIAIMDVIRSFFNNRMEWEKSNPIVVNNKVSNNAIIKPAMKKKPTKRGKIEIQY